MTLTAIGAVATAAGGRGVLRGSAEVIGGGPVSANVDSEYRFYAAWYPIAGVVLLRAARHPETAGPAVRAFSAGMLVAACGRTLSMRKLGPPSGLQRVLMGFEYVLPAVIVPWQAAIERRSSSGRWGAVR